MGAKMIVAVWAAKTGDISTFFPLFLFSEVATMECIA